MEINEIVWVLEKQAMRDLEALRENLGESAYAEQKKAFQELLVTYFEQHAGCMGQSVGISPISPAPPACKALKVRWALPGGGGKRGGLRVIVVVNCDAKRVALVRAPLRRDVPDDADIAASTSASSGALAVDGDDDDDA